VRKDWRAIAPPPRPAVRLQAARNIRRERRLTSLKTRNTAGLEAIYWRTLPMGKLTENIKGTVNETIGKAKQQSDKPEDKAEGKTQELKGNAQKVKGKVHGAMGDDI
jgi:uncharacterized protein YjbJ (UPF0337 family)